MSTTYWAKVSWKMEDLGLQMSVPTGDYSPLTFHGYVLASYHNNYGGLANSIASPDYEDNPRTGMGIVDLEDAKFLLASIPNVFVTKGAWVSGSFKTAGIEPVLYKASIDEAAAYQVGTQPDPVGTQPFSTSPIGQTQSITLHDDLYREDRVFSYTPWAWTKLTVPSNPLFTLGADEVKFNDLLPTQIESIKAGEGLYASLSGNDKIYLPTVANAKNLAGSTGVEYRLDRFFALGDGTDVIYGSADGPTNATLGSGSDTIYLTDKSVTTLAMQPGRGRLNLQNFSANSNLTLTNYVAGNVVDIAGSNANQTSYDPVTHILDLYNVTYGQKQSVKVGSIHLSGDFAGKDFALSDDSAGGRFLKVADAPTTLTLAELSAAAYGDVPAPSGYTLLMPELSLSGGFGADAFADKDRSNIIIAIRGTVFSALHYYDMIKNLIADGSFANSAANGTIAASVRQASAFLSQLRTDNRFANIEITGHSLGAAIADLLGVASHYQTVAFNAPGAGDLITQLSGPLQAAEKVSTPLDGGIQNVRLAGDQVSLVGASPWPTLTLANTTNSSGWPYAALNHRIGTIISALSNIPISVASEPALPGFLTGATVFGYLVKKINFSYNVPSANQAVSFDPPGASTYIFTGNLGSPEMTGITLPYLSGVASYAVAVERAGVWSADMNVLPGVAYVPGTPFEAVRFSPLDSNKASVSAIGSLVFDMTFASAGLFTGQLTIPSGVVSRPVQNPGPHDILLAGSHDQYVIAKTSDGQAEVMDTVAGRDGTQVVPGLQHLLFADGTGLFDPTGNVEAVTRLYQAAFNRAPDAPGIDYSTALVNAGSISIAKVADGFITSDEFVRAYGNPDTRTFVTSLYQNVLHRPVNPSDPLDVQGVQNFSNLADSQGRGAALLAMSDSQENHRRTLPISGDRIDAETTRLYQAAFNRAPDAAGFDFMQNVLRSGVPADALAEGFVASGEFQRAYGSMSSRDFVAQLYRNVLHREADQGGLDQYTRALDANYSRGFALASIADSTENRILTAGVTHDAWVFIPA